MKRAAITALSAAAALAVSPAIGQQTGSGGQQPPPGSMQKHQSQQRPGASAQQQPFEGSIQGTRTVTIQGQPHVLAKVRSRTGDNLVVDLGPAADLKQKNVRLKRGQQISGQGQPGRIDGRPIIVVDLFTTPTAGAAGSQTIQPRTQARAGQQDFKHVVQGKVIDTRGVKLKGAEGEHNLMKLRSGDREIVVDLGSKQNTQDLGLQQGDRVIVVGDMARIEGRPVLYASSVAELTRIDRGQAGQSGSMGSSSAGGGNSGNQR